MDAHFLQGKTYITLHNMNQRDYLLASNYWPAHYFELLLEYLAMMHKVISYQMFLRVDTLNRIKGVRLQRCLGQVGAEKGMSWC